MDHNPSDALCAAIAGGDYLCVRDAARRTGIEYWALWRRLRRERFQTFRVRGRRYVSVSDLENPRLRVP